MPVIEKQNKYCENNPSVHNQGKLVGHCQDFEMEHPISSYLPDYFYISDYICSFTVEGFTESM